MAASEGDEILVRFLRCGNAGAKPGKRMLFELDHSSHGQECTPGEVNF